MRIDVFEIAVLSSDVAASAQDQLVVRFEAGTHRRFGVAGSTVRLPLDANGAAHSLHVVAVIGVATETYACV